MSLMTGTRLGPYQVLGPIGAGGMGEVYKAHDARLSRDVAIKIVAAASRTDPDRLHRFEHEARAAAALNHPNILAVYDIGQHDGSPYIVSELLDGETLRERGASPLPVRTAVEYAIQIARGLAAAHEKGIVHRDLKPENLFVTTDERVKILDFGLAKLVQPETSSATALPTAATHTREGVVLGTMGYMAPEQIRGLPADQRADIFAFGAILYEMLSGTRAFGGDTAADVMTGILKEDPPVLPLEARHIPPGLARIVDRCVAKSPNARFRSADDLAFALESLSAASSSSGEGRSAAAAASRPRLGRWTTAAVLLAVGLLVGAGGLARLSWFAQTATADAKPVVRVQLLMPESISVLLAQPPAVSPDGSRIALAALDRDSGRHAIYLRSFDNETAQLVAGTDRAVYPFWSHDGRRLAFFANGRLKTVEVTTGAVQDVCSVPNPAGPGVWVDDTIVFSRTVGPVLRVAASGGTPVPATPFDPARENTQMVTGFLSDRKHFIFGFGGLRGLGISTTDQRTAEPLISDVPRALLQAPWLLGPARTDGQLLFIRQTTLVAQQIDGAGRVTGTPTPIAQGVAPLPTTGGAVPGSAQESVLAYLSGTANARRLMWFSREGHPLGQASRETGFFRDLAFSPDGTRLAVSRYNNGDRRSDLLVIDLSRDTSSHLAYGTGLIQASWVNQSELLAVASSPAYTIGRVAAKEGAALAPLLKLPDAGVLQPQVTPDGQTLLYTSVAPDGDFDIYTGPMANPTDRHTWRATPAAEYQARLSPDGRAVAYASNPDPTGPVDIFVQSFDGDGRDKKQVSQGGGVRPVWRRDSGELFFLSPEGDLMAAPVNTNPTLTVGPASKLFRTPIDPGTMLATYQYAVHPDGKRFVIVAPMSDVPQPIYVILNWQTLLKK